MIVLIKFIIFLALLAAFYWLIQRMDITKKSNKKK